MKVKNSKRWRFLWVTLSSMLCSSSILHTANAYELRNDALLTQEDNGSLTIFKDGRRSIRIANTSEMLHLDGSYQVSVGNNTYGRLRKANSMIQLQGGRTFDPLQMKNFASAQNAKAVVPDLYMGGMANVNAYIIQFNTQALPDYQQVLRKAGVDLGIAVPPNSMIALMGEVTKVKVAKLPFVRAAVDFLPAYKLQDGLEAVIAANTTGTQEYSIMSIAKKYRGSLMKFTESIGGEVIKNQSNLPQAKGSRFSANLTADQLLQVSQRAETLFIDVRGEEGEDLGQVREREGFNYVETVTGYCGQGVGFEVYDRGFLLSHQELVNKTILVRSPAASTSAGGVNHGTEISGMMYAAGISMDKGLIHCAARPIVFSRYSGFPSNRQPTEAQLRSHLAELVDPKGKYRAIAQTSSTDYTQTTSYTTWSAEYDEALFELDFIKLQSQSNTGSRRSRPAAWAKNVVSVGGFATSNTVDRSDDRWGRASIGPAADDRIKPDFAGQYGGIRTIDDTSDRAYRNFGGTSGATPTVGGAFAIMFQMWADGVFDGGPGKARDVFDARPHASTAKALMVHSAYRYAFSGGDSANMSRVHQGWGAPDLKNLYDTAKANNWRYPILVNEDDVLVAGGKNSYTLTVDGTQPIKVTMAYRDPRGNPAAALHRINDLSLRLTSPTTGTVYWGNNGLRNGNWSTPGGTSNTIDTTENVFIQAPETGTWRIDVLGDDVVQDGHLPTPAIDAAYALVATGGTSAPPVNQAPKVNAGSDREVYFPNPAQLAGTVSDDGLPFGAKISTTWVKISGPGRVTFDNPALVNSKATFSALGKYVLRLTASDSALSNSDDVVMTISPQPANLPPVVNAGTDQTSLVGRPVSLQGSVTDDGLPNPPAAYKIVWTKVSGPGNVVFSNERVENPKVTFSVEGNYVLRLTASDGAAEASDDVRIKVKAAAATTVLEANNFENGRGKWRNTATRIIDDDGDNSSGDDDGEEGEEEVPKGSANKLWRRDANGTSTKDTGPQSGSGNSKWYAYLETSKGRGAYRAGDTAILEGPRLAGSARVMTFDYHMYGAHIGTLSVDVQSGGVWTEDVLRISGQQHDSNTAPYSQATVDLTPFSGAVKVRFRAVAAGGFKGDMAIDNIEIRGVGAP